jgi:LacI family transcriptional regulator
VAVTIYDIAERAGVSIATVSRVFSGGARVADKTRERVFKIAEELGYEPNVSARSLARQATQVVSMVLPTMTSYFFMEVIRGVQDCLAEANYDLLVYAGRTADNVDTQLSRAVQSGRADGVLVCSLPLAPARLERLQNSGVPLVLVDSIHPDFDSVAVNNVEGGYTAARHLIELGYKRMGLILPHPDPAPGRERREGFERAIREAGRRLDASAVYVSDDLQQHGYTVESGYTAMQALLGRAQPPDAVFAACDEQALGALKALSDANLDCPSDVAVIGFDNIRTSAYVGLTTLAQPMYEMGRAAAEKLLQRMLSPDRPVSHTVFSPRLIIRETTVCPSEITSRENGAEGVRARNDLSALA